MKLGAVNQIATPNTKAVAPQAGNANSPEPVPTDSYKPSKRSYGKAIKSGLIGAAAIGLPAAFGAGAKSLVSDPALRTLGQAWIGGAAGAAGGYAITPGKEQGGLLLLGPLIIPAGAVAGAYGLPLLSSIGAKWGLQGAAVAAGISGIVAAGAEAYFVYKDNAKSAA